ncbi:hypothetical protein GCM10019017_40690 [Streptomyces showdoensis]
MRSQATKVLASAVWSRSSASHGFAVSERAVRRSTGPRARTYEVNDGYAVFVGYVAYCEAPAQTGPEGGGVMAQRYERPPVPGIGPRSRTALRLRL